MESLQMRTRSILISTMIIFGGISSANAGYWTTLDLKVFGQFPAAIYGIDGGNVVGTYRDAYDNSHGFLYNGTDWTIIDKSGADYTIVESIGGNNLVGYYSDSSGDNGFVYDYIGRTWTVLNGPGGGFYPYDIDSGKIVGWWYDGSFLYDGTTWTKLDFPGAWQTYATGISGDKIVGTYNNNDGSGQHSFLYDGTTWRDLNKPGADFTLVSDISGNRIVGDYKDAFGRHGFLYDGTSWITLDFPGVSNTGTNGISGDNIIGWYTDTSGAQHGFLYTIPEPATMVLIGLGGMAVLRRRRKK